MILMMALMGGYLALMALAPSPLWRSVLWVSWRTATCRHLPLSTRARLLGYVCRDVLLTPFHALLHGLDELVFRAYRDTPVSSPVFIIGQPRSGTTFLHRTLAQAGGFISLSHLEWRYPFVCLWRALDLFGLRRAVESVHYWPDNAVGRAARKMHEHRLGSFEEHGIFLEERFYQHYFVFRRFPVPELLASASGFAHLPPRDKTRLLSGLRRAVQKAMYYRGSNQVWLTKENESIELHELMAEAFPEASYVFIARDPAAFVDSYVNLSVTSTQSKTGIDPRSIPGWHEANIAFRREECRRMVAFSARVQATNRCVMVAYEDLVNDVSGVVSHIFNGLGLPVTSRYAALLAELDERQRQRDRGYDNPAHSVAGFEFFAAFARDIKQAYADASRGLTLDVAAGTQGDGLDGGAAPGGLTIDDPVEVPLNRAPASALTTCDS